MDLAFALPLAKALMPPLPYLIKLFPYHLSVRFLALFQVRDVRLDDGDLLAMIPHIVFQLIDLAHKGFNGGGQSLYPHLRLFPLDNGFVDSIEQCC